MIRRPAFSFAMFVIIALICGGAGRWTVVPIAKPVRGIGYSDAVIVDGVIVFMQLGTDSGIKRWEDGKVTTLLPGKSPVPMSTGLFQGLSRISFDGTRVAFIGHSGKELEGVYVWNVGQVNRIVDTTMDIPGKPGPKLRYIHSTSISGSLVAFSSTDHNAKAGIYCADDAGLHLIALQGTPAPGSRDNFNSVSGGFAGNGAVIFDGLAAKDPQHFVEGVYSYQNGSITTLFDTTRTFSPGGRFAAMEVTSSDGQDVAGHGQLDRALVFFKYVKGKPTAVVSSHQPMPATNGRITAAEMGAIKNGTVACLVGQSPGRILVSDAGGTLAKIAATGETLDGKQISQITLTPQATDGKRVVFTVMYRDMTSMIYIATAPTK